MKFKETKSIDEVKTNFAEMIRRRREEVEQEIERIEGLNETQRVVFVENYDPDTKAEVSERWR